MFSFPFHLAILSFFVAFSALLFFQIFVSSFVYSKMSQLIEKWLAEEVTLSKPLSALEKDFANGLKGEVKFGYLLPRCLFLFSGFLFGEVLFKLDYLSASEFRSFSDSSSASVVINNYALLSTKLKSMGISFSSKVCFRSAHYKSCLFLPFALH